MKKINKLLLPLTMILAMGIGVLNATINNKKTLNEVKANTNNSSFGVFVKVDHPDWSVEDGGLQTGDKIIFLATDGDGNNPISFKAPINNGGQKRISYTTMEDDYARTYIDNGGKECFILTGSCAEMFSVNKIGDNKFAFHGVTGGAFAHYLSYDGNQNLIDSSSDSLNDNVYWALEGGYSIGGYETPSKPACAIRLENTSGLGSMYINNQDGSFKCSNPAGTFFQVYKEVMVVGAALDTLPNRTTYYQQDPVDYTGLKIQLIYKKDNQDTNHIIEGVSCDDLPNLIVGDANVTSDQNRVNFTVFPNTLFYQDLNFPISKPDRVGTYVQNNGGIVDKRATYHFVREDTGINHNNYIFNPLVTPQGGNIDVGGNMRPISLNANYDTIEVSNTNYSYLDSLAVITVTREIVDDELNYYYKTSNGKYLAIRANTYDLYLSDTPASKAVLYNEGGNGVVNIEDHGVRLTLGFHEGSGFSDSYFKFVDGKTMGLHDYTRVELYKRDYKESEEPTNAVEMFKNALIAATANCDNTGSQNNVDLSAWAGLVSKFNSMSEDAKGYFGSLTYNHGQEVKNSSKDLMDRYDYIVTKYGYTDFINRGENGTLKNNYSSQIVNVIPSVEATSPTLILVISILGVSSLAFVLYFLYKKRKNK